MTSTVAQTSRGIGWVQSARQLLAAMSVENTSDPWYEVVPFDDRTLRVRGTLPPWIREQIERSCLDTGTCIDGWSVWVPRGTGDDA